MKKLLIIMVIALALSACTFSTDNTKQPALESRIESMQNQVKELTPGLGEIMGVIQQHHAKLYYSADAGNWELAKYQLGEIEEGLDAAAKLYPQFKDVKTRLDVLVPTMTKDDIESLFKAIEKKNRKDFMLSYGKLTNSCNACHNAANRGFIVIQTPTTSEFSNQKFEP